MTSNSDDNALEAFRAALRAQPGQWFALHTEPGDETDAKVNLESRIAALDLTDYIYEVVRPTAIVGTAMAGYLLVRMDFTDERWAAVRRTPLVTGYVGERGQPLALGLDTVTAMLSAAMASAGNGHVELAVGDDVVITAGPFQKLHATIVEVDLRRRLVKAALAISDPEAPIELSIDHVKRP